MNHHKSLSLVQFRRQVSALPLIPDGLTPVLARLGEEWRVGEPWAGKPKNTLTVVFTASPSLEVAVGQTNKI